MKTPRKDIIKIRSKISLDSQFNFLFQKENRNRAWRRSYISYLLSSLGKCYWMVAQFLKNLLLSHQFTLPIFFLKKNKTGKVIINEFYLHGEDYYKIHFNFPLSFHSFLIKENKRWKVSWACLGLWAADLLFSLNSGSPRQDSPRKRLKASLSASTGWFLRTRSNA